MRIRPGIILATLAVFALLFGGRYLGWFGGKPKDTSSEPALDTTSRSPQITPVPAPAPLALPVRNAAAAPTTPAPGHPAAGEATVPPAGLATESPAGVITDWEHKIDDVLTGKEEEDQKAKRLLELLPRFPESGQVEAAQHLSNLLPDEQYASLAPMLTNAHTAEAVLDVLMTDVLNRPNPIKLSTLLDVARTPEHPKAEEARDILEVFVDENYGNNWDAWDAAVKKWLKDNPEE